MICTRCNRDEDITITGLCISCVAEEGRMDESHLVKIDRDTLQDWADRLKAEDYAPVSADHLHMLKHGYEGSRFIRERVAKAIEEVLSI